ncbi:glycosyltransferase [Prevotella bivia]|uniref:Glycosyltransferase, group 2 family protein n=1 Tax=Prevotella bivia TaxID=28125 RepID=A0A137SZ41_9BACT|nr:glycosyltransferase [Prevotella bivia]KXO17733.1 glycosyltransferase, group 2 family protein [Prevotella bivia]KXU55834.1 glycosyltransferase, group 2 family protein [Prevotella bivia]
MIQIDSKQELPLLSIIIPVYNGSSFLESLINSIILYNEDILNSIEIILVDDGSTDNSLELCEEYEQKYPCVKFFTKPNEGIAKTRLFGLNNAKGRYITFCDQDDLVVQGYSYFLYKMIEQQVDLLISNRYEYNQNGNMKLLQFFKEDEICEDEKINQIRRYLLVGGKFYDGFVFDNFIPYFPTSIWNCIFHRQLIIDNNIIFKVIVDFEDDWNFFIESCIYAKKILLSAKAYYCWRINIHSESHTQKYITDFFRKRQLEKKYLNNLLDKISATVSERQYRACLEKKRTLIYGFYNANILSFSLFKREMDLIIEGNSPIPSDIYKFQEGKLENFYLFFLLHKLYAIPYFLNRYLFKRKYH